MMEARRKYIPCIDACGTKLHKVIIANRAEIASRIIRTCRELGIESVAIYVKQDQKSSFWREADHAYYAGDLERDGNVYLDITRLISIARKVNADAIHPGYGYLSENAAFAHAVVQAGLTWIGPKAETIEILGDKAQCKQFLAERAQNVPLVPGVRLMPNSQIDLHAREIGYPILLKASAGGGGKGMRIVNEEADLASALNMAQSEARRSFGSDDMLLEKYIAKGKHIEVQMFGDSHGNIMTFGTRECSVQRRHQKVIEEAPAHISAELEEKMIEAAISIGKATAYLGAGTVEFIVDVSTQQAYFLEVNTRIQVEHPITEEIYNIDIVALQLFVAAGGSLNDIPKPSRQGHAIELRLCAEDPYADFVPQIGRITLFAKSSLEARYESSVKTGDEVSINFDPMICKIIVFRKTRDEATRHARKVLLSTTCLGIQTNQSFMAKCLQHESFSNSTYTTSLISENPALLQRDEIDHGKLLVSALYRALHQPSGEPSTMLANSVETISTPTGQEYALQRQFDRNSDHNSYKLAAWSVLEPKKLDQSKALNKEGHKLAARFYHSQAQARTIHDIEVSSIERRHMDNYDVISAQIRITNSGFRVLATVEESHGVSVVHLDRYGRYTRRTGLVAFGRLDSRSSRGRGGESGNEYRAPMPCKVIRIDTTTKSTVKTGQGLLVVESMKTEIRILSRVDGTVVLAIKEGDVVPAGALLATVE